MATPGLAQPAPAARHRRGRPSRLSREAVLDAAIALLEQGGLEGFTLAALAKRLDAGVMSLYTYFPNRDALLLAVSDAIYSRFQYPKPCSHWQDEMRGWMWAVVDLFDRYPVAVKLSMWDGHVSPAWLRTWMPLVNLLKRQGLEGSRLAFALSWFTTATLGFITAQRQSPGNRRSETLAHIATLEPAEQRLASELWLDFEAIDRNATLEFGFNNILLGIERFINADQPAARFPDSASGRRPRSKQRIATKEKDKSA